MTTQNKYNSATEPLMMSVLHNNSNSNTPPIWFMRQAGRYLPEYRNIRKNMGSFLNLCKNPEQAAEVTLQPIKRFEFDAAIMFSDILVIPEAMGMDLEFIEEIGPVFKNPIKNYDDINKLNKMSVLSNLQFVMQTIKNIKQELSSNKALIGFSGSPFTLACYMLEGRSSKSTLNKFPRIASWIQNSPDELLYLLDMLANVIVDYVIAQINSGVDIVMIFDTWGGILSPENYKIYSLNFMEQIAQKVKLIKPNVPLIAFTKSQEQSDNNTLINNNFFVNSMHSMLNHSNFDVIGVDHNIDIMLASNNLTNKIIQGNFNPNVLAEGDTFQIAKEANNIMSKIHDSPHKYKYIFNLGHGILPQTSPDSVKYLIDLIRLY